MTPTSMFYVIKRNGNKEPFNMYKVEKVVKFAMDSSSNRYEFTEQDISQFFDEFHFMFKNGITTKELQHNLIKTAQRLIYRNNQIEPKFSVLANRLYLMDFWKELRLQREREYDSENTGIHFDEYGMFKRAEYWVEHVRKYAELGIYDERLLKINKEILMKLYVYAKELNKEREQHFMWDNFIYQTEKFVRSYLIKYEGKPIETFDEALLLLAIMGFYHDYKNKELFINNVQKFYRYLTNYYFIPATPQLLNLRRQNGNLSSCNIMDMHDNLESIYYTLTQTALISKNAGGIGIYAGRLRPSGSYLMGNPGISNDVRTWFKLVEDTAIAVNQGGIRCLSGDTKIIRVKSIKINGKEYQPDDIIEVNGKKVKVIDYVNMHIESGKTKLSINQLPDSYSYEEVYVNQVKEGDYILSYDTQNKKKQIAKVNKVIKTYVHEKKQAKVEFANRNDNLITSTDTLLYIDELGSFEYVNNIKKLIDEGKELHTINHKGQKVKVSNVETGKEFFSDYVFYDFNIDKTHCFFAGRDNEYYLVHNSGAVTVALPIWHKDILEYLQSRNPLGEKRMKLFDIYQQVTIPDYFMEKVKNKEPWYLVDHYEIQRIDNSINLIDTYGDEFKRNYQKVEKLIQEGKLRNYIKVSAVQVLQNLFDSFMSSGFPYIFFEDNANKYSPFKEKILCGNLCMESFSPFRNTNPENRQPHEGIPETEIGYAHSCNLFSLNLPRLYEDGILFDDEKLKEVTELVVRYMDNILEVANPPVMEIKKHNQHYRTIGIGYIGFADLLVKLSIDRNQLITYQFTKRSAGDEQRRNELKQRLFDIVKQVFGRTAFYIIRGSVKLAKERGHAPKYPETKWSDGILLGRFNINDGVDKLAEVFSVNESDIEETITELKRYGIRNTMLLNCPPNTSTSLYAGTTASILPAYNIIQAETQRNGTYIVFPRYVDIGLLYYNSYINSDAQDMYDIIEFIAEVQKYIDSGISFEWIINRAKLEGRELIKYLTKVLFLSHKLGIKTLYYARSLTTQGSDKGKKECVACAN